MSGSGIMLSGWLRKSPPEKKMRRFSWKKRWFVLKSGRLTGDPNVLEYFKTQASKRPLKVINLNDCIQIDVNVPIKPDRKDSANQFVFDIVTSGRTFYLVADSIREMSSWVHCLCDLCGFNHDSNDKNDLATEQQTFKAVPAICRDISGNGNAATSLLNDTDTDVPDPNPRPSNTMSALSKPLENGSANHHSNTGNGYDIPDDECTPLREDLDVMPSHSDFYSPSKQATFHTPEPNHPDNDPDSNGYLHLTDFETPNIEEKSPNVPGFLEVTKSDERRCSTDSVFTHEGACDDSTPESEPVPSLMNSQHLLKPLLKIKQGRLSSMPDCPPPLPPTNVAPHRGEYSYPPDDDEDIVADARRKPTFSRTTLPPIDDCDMYKVPPNLQRQHRVNEDGTPLTGSFSSNRGTSSSSYGSHGASGYYGISDGRGFPGKITVSGPEYVNTSDSHSSSSTPKGNSLSTPGGLAPYHQSSSSVFSSPVAKSMYDIPSPLSPIFPMVPGPIAQQPNSHDGSLPISHPGPSGQSSAHSSSLSSMGSNYQKNLPKHDLLIKHQLRKIPMLDVSSPAVVYNSPGGNYNGGSLYSTPSNVPMPEQSLYSSPTEPGFYKRDISQPNAGGIYDVPPARPPKPPGSLFDQTVEGTTPSPSLPIQNNESLYSTPRSPSFDSAFGSIADPANIYNVVRTQSPLSPPHTTVIGTMSDDQRLNIKFPNLDASLDKRKTMSASNSPLATPNFARRNVVGKTPSFNLPSSTQRQGNKQVSGSAPSIYDVPQKLLSMPFSTQVNQQRSSQSSSASGDGSYGSSSARNSGADTSIYEVPRRIVDGTASPKLATNDALQKFDDIQHPSYEKMMNQGDQLSDSEEANPYTPMAGATMLAGLESYSPSMHVSPHPAPPGPMRMMERFGSQDVQLNMPPPVHRDLKPGRRSLGSDGSDKRKNARDSFESDEAVSPPHTTITHTMPMLSDQGSFSYRPTYNTLPAHPTSAASRSNSMTSPQNVKNRIVGNDQLRTSPVPPQRPPKGSNHSSISPRSPPMATPATQLPGRPYTPTHGMHHTSRTLPDRHFTTQGVPQRPPKPSNMKIPPDTNTQVWDDNGLSPPRRPPKSSDDSGVAPYRPPKKSSITPSTGDSMFSTGSLFFPAGYNPMAIVPPPEQGGDKEIKYIEIKDFPTQNNGSASSMDEHLSTQDRSVARQSVEYIQLDVGKTRALEKMKNERQKAQQMANTELQSTVKGKDKFR